MSACARCGADDCEAEWGRKEALACRDRELSNLRSLLRSVTKTLEVAAELNEADEPEASLTYIQKALEALS